MQAAGECWRGPWVLRSGGDRQAVWRRQLADVIGLLLFVVRPSMAGVQRQQAWQTLTRQKVSLASDGTGGQDERDIL